MKQVTINVFSFAELENKAKNKARAYYRENWRDTSDFQFVLDDAKAVAALLGFDIEINGWDLGGVPSLSYKTTPGLALDAVAKVKEYAPLDTKLHGIAEAWVISCKTLNIGESANFQCTVSTGPMMGWGYPHSFTDMFERHGDQSFVDTHIMDIDIAKAVLERFGDWIMSRLQDEDEYLDTDEAIGNAFESHYFLEDGRYYGTITEGGAA